MTETLVLVDGADAEVGTATKERCHEPDGLLHRAFTALVFDGSGRLALARRDAAKPLWPGRWDGTFASHPRVSEPYVDAGERRMPEELGARCDLAYLHKFEYHIPYGDAGSENEVCATLAGWTDGELRGAPGEIDAVRHVTAGQLAGEMASDPRAFCPWMLVALRLLGGSDPAALAGLPAGARAWAGRMDGELDRAIAAHMGPDRWRLVDEG
ncbi:MAG: NUDIX domain-containing protein [Nitrosopumilus sp.]|nr:NUDIX domain-containing protein [Nitrosopumilus sp.]CAI9830999.1 Isopentenyl-diphosphate delta-isomerase [Nitrosopumilaceae archaeon]MDA7941711.1 NUDIX domain-containing protein [Nitrosopumilus sp.]MDA7944977.1 NUDIX domain-containing protein [Nitrosopumilus sp.]MDA7953238.1 NUDIX domain-containing protein [Nitrosopumilus sp.]